MNALGFFRTTQAPRVSLTVSNSDSIAYARSTPDVYTLGSGWLPKVETAHMTIGSSNWIILNRRAVTGFGDDPSHKRSTRSNSVAAAVSDLIVRVGSISLVFFTRKGMIVRNNPAYLY